jgi:hypothetical protein
VDATAYMLNSDFPLRLSKELVPPDGKILPTSVIQLVSTA